MKIQSNQQQIKSIYEMLFEMATGNFSLRLQPAFNNPELDKLALVLNCVAQEMQNAIVKAGHVNPHYSYQNLIQNIVLLDTDLTIKSYNAAMSKTLAVETDEIIEMNFRDILSPKSQKVWDKIKEEALVNESFHGTARFTFRSKNKQVIPLFCTVSRLYCSNQILISSVTTILEDLLLDVPASKSLPKKSDAAIAQQLHDYILSNLEEPLPTIPQLAILFNTNEYTLKECFRHFFKTSIYRFYINERVKKGHSLIRKTDIPLKEIAYISGFNDYVTFSKAFKKKFGYTPSDLKRG